jgi:hypothetical protein
VCPPERDRAWCSRAVDASVDSPDGGCCLLGLGLVAERDQVEGAQRAHEPPPEVTVVSGVLGNTARDERMADLEQDRGTAAQERCQGRVARRRMTLSGLK